MHPDESDFEMTQPNVPPPPAFGERFRVLRALGTGAMGDVYLAEDTKLHRRVAIKCIRSEHRGSALFLQRIKRECLLHARIGAHPHIVTLYDLLESEDQLLIVMEFVDGEALDVVLKRQAGSGKSLSPAWCAAIAVQCLHALAHTHKHGIIHRDIKPANVILDGNARGTVCAKLMDFGIARLEEEDPAITSLTQPGARSPGTPLYMSPEQIDSGTYGPVTPSADIYAMGVMLYHMLSGRPPFTGTMTDIFNGHLNYIPKPIMLDTGAPLVPAFAAVLARAMAKRPADRFPSAEAFADALRPFLSGDIALTAASAPAASAPTARQPRVRPAKKPVGLAVAAGFFMLLAVSGGLWWATSRGGDQAPLEPAQALALRTEPEPDAAPEEPAPIPVAPVAAPAESSTPTIEEDRAGTANATTEAPIVETAAPANLPPATGDAATEVWTLETVTLPNPAPVYSAPEPMLDDGPLPEIIPPATAPQDSEPTAAPPAPLPEEQEALETVAQADTMPDTERTAAETPAPAVLVIAPTHIVQPGDTIQAIATKYDLDTSDLIRWNRLDDPDALSVGQTLYLYERPGPPPADTPIPAEPEPETKGSPGQVFKEDVKDVWDKAGRGLRNLGRKVRNVGK